MRFLGRHSRTRTGSWILLSIIPVLPVCASGHRIGTECAEEYEYHWETTLTTGWEICDGFNAQIDNTETLVYYYDLVGAKYYWESTDELDQVDLLYVLTHGGITPTYDSARWSMWDESEYAYSSQMRLGDQATQLSVFAQHVCSTLKYSDGYQQTRWKPIFKGGLRYAVGSHDLIYASTSTLQHGSDFASHLQAGWTIRESWRSALADPYFDNDVAAAASGNTWDNCVERLWADDGTLSGIMSFGRLRDANVSSVCIAAWSNQ